MCSITLKLINCDDNKLILHVEMWTAFVQLL